MTHNMHHEALSEFDFLAQSIRSATRGKSAVYVANPGNLGDALIRYGTKLFLHQAGIKHHEIAIGGPGSTMRLMIERPLRLMRQSVLLLGGGGAWGPHYSGTYALAQRLSRLGESMFVLPSTFGVKVQSVNGVLFRRDNGISAQSAKDSIFCHDLAMYVALKRDELSYHLVRPSRKVLYAFRTDLESRIPSDARPQNNWDVSADGDHLDNADILLNRVADAEIIVTDRLHVAIAGLIAKRRVFLYEGAYSKIRNIFECSMSVLFPGEIELLPWCPGDDLQKLFSGSSTQ